MENKCKDCTHFDGMTGTCEWPLAIETIESIPFWLTCKATRSQDGKNCDAYISKEQL